MPRTKLICIECHKEIPANDTKKGEAVIVSTTTFAGEEVKLIFCKRCGIEHKMGQYKYTEGNYKTVGR